MPGFRGSATCADGVAAIGLAEAGKVRRAQAIWRQTIIEHDISRLIADFAPLALWAAVGLPAEGQAIRIVNLGVGHTVPPPGLATFAPVLPGRSDTADQIAAASSDPIMAAKAREVGLDLRGKHPANPLANLVKRLTPVVAEARADLR